MRKQGRFGCGSRFPVSLISLWHWEFRLNYAMCFVTRFFPDRSCHSRYKPVEFHLTLSFSLYFLASSVIMSLTLDNIQFYHGPSKPAKKPNFAFNSKKHGSGTMPSFHLPAITNGSIDDFLPATHLEGTIEQQTAHPSNLFDLEIAKSWEMISLPGERGACRLKKPTPDRHYPEYIRCM